MKSIPPGRDAFGRAMWAYLQGAKSFELIERDDGLVDLSMGAPAYFQEFERWPLHQRRAIRFVKGRALDVGAGAGRVALHLQKLGHRVTAIDNSPFAVKVCRKRGVKDVRLLPFERVDLLAPARFDTVVMYGNNFGLFGGPSGAKVLLGKLERMTAPGALIVAESNDPYKTNDPAHLSYHRFNRNRGRMPGQLRIRVRFRQYVGPWFDYLLVSQDEMRSILDGTGWKVKTFVDSPGSAYIAVIERR